MNESIKKNRINLKIEATSLTILLISVLLLTFLSGTQLIEEVSAIDYNEYTGTLDGADWALRIPDPWNGMLVMACRGGSPTLPDPLSTLSMDGSYMLNQGYAVAASNYGEVRICIQAGVNGTYELTKHIIDNYNFTGRIFLSGASLGGTVALLLGERYPDLYSGVLDFFGIKDLKDRYNRHIRWANLSDAELEAEVTALGITTIPPPIYSTLQEWRDKMKNHSRAIEWETGGTPETHPQEYEDRSLTYHANIMIPVITVHGTDDAIVPYYQSLMYQDAVADAGCSHLYRLYNVTGGGHNGGTSNERPERFDELVEWSNYLTGVYDWPMFRHDLTHSGYSESPAPDTNQTLWNYTTENAVESSPVVADDKVYVGSNDNNLYCLDAATGELIWNYTTGDTVRSSAAVADGNIYVSSWDNKVYCLNASTGTHIWNYTTDGVPDAHPSVVSGNVYIGSNDGTLYCLDAANGTQIWNYTTGGMVYSSPLVVDGKVYFGSHDDKVYCLNASTGTHIWNYTTGDNVSSSPIFADGNVYVGSYDKKVYCLDATSGTLVWNYTTGGSVSCSPALAGGIVYIGSFDNKVHALNASTGALIWNYTTGGLIWLSSPAVADDKVYVGSIDNSVYCLNATTGASIWNYTTGGMVNSSPAVANGVVYIGSMDGQVYALGTEYFIPEGLGVEVVLLLSALSRLVLL